MTIKDQRLRICGTQMPVHDRMERMHENKADAAFVKSAKYKWGHDRKGVILWEKQAVVSPFKPRHCKLNLHKRKLNSAEDKIRFQYLLLT